MAELVAHNGARFPIPPEAGLVGRHAEDGAAEAPDVDLGGLEGGRTVSRQHVRIYRSGSDWYLKVQSRARNATVVAGQLLLPDQETKLRDGDEIKLGTVSVVFRADGEAPPAPPDPNRTMVRDGANAPAELRAGDVRVPLTVADGHALTVGRHSTDNAYRPDVDLRQLPKGSTISRRHALLVRRGQTWFLRVEVDSRNPTYQNGRQLQKGQEVALADGDELRMGDVVVTFRQERPVQYTDLLELTLGPPTDVTLEAGAQQALPLTLINFSGRVDWFVLDVSGIPRDWWTIVLPDGTTAPADQLPQVRLDTAAPPVPTPTATAKATLVLSPPRRADAPAGTYPLLISATSLDNRRLRRTTTGQLVVNPFAGLRLSLEPNRQSGGRGRFRLGVFNDGNASTTVSVSAETDKKVQASVDPAELTLANSAQAAVDVALRLKHRSWLGPEVVHKAVINAHGSLQNQVLVQEAQLACPPRVPLWLQHLVGRIQADLKPIVAMLAILGALLVAGYLWLLPPDITLVPDAPLIASGGSTALSWNVRRGDGRATLEGPSGTQQVDLPSGSVAVSPDQNTEYKLTAKNLIGITATSSAKIQVLRATLSASPDTPKPGEPVTLQWTTENATSVSIDPSDEITAPPTSGKTVVHPRTSTTYRLVATNDRAGVQVTAEARATFGAPRVALQQDHQQVFPGDPVTLTWTADGWTSLTLKANPDDLDLKDGDQDLTPRGSPSSVQVRPVRTTHYTLVAANADGTTTEAQVPVTVVPLKRPSIQAPLKPISAGETATLTWKIEGANDRTRVVLQPDGTDVSGRTSVDVRPGQTTQYTLEVTAADGQMIVSDPVTIGVLPAIQDFRVVPAAVTEGDPVVLSWTVVSADSVTVTRDDGVFFQGKPTDQARDHPPATVSSYTIKAHNATGDSVDSPASVVKIKVQPPPTLPPLPQIPSQAGV